MAKKKETTKKQLEKWVKPIIEKITKVLLLQDRYPIEFTYGVSTKSAYMECAFRYPYKSIIIRYSDEAIADFEKGDKDSIRESLVHEMCHPITDPLYSKAMDRFVSNSEINDEREALTDHIANIVLKNIKI